MADVPASSPKICSICGLDCSNKQRTKDAQGKYICAECIAHAKQARAVQQAPKAAPAAPPKTVASTEADNAFLLDIPGPGAKKSDAATKPCPSCFKPMEENTLVCMSCGFNTKTGEQLKVRVIKAKEVEERPDRRQGYSNLADIPEWVWAFAVILCCAGPLCIAAFTANTTLFNVGSVILGVTGLVTWIMMLLDAFRSSTAHGLLYLLLPCLPFGFLYHIYYAFFVCESATLKYVFLGTIVATILSGVCLGMNPDFLESMQS